MSVKHNLYNNMYDLLIVGAGFFGSSLANLAVKNGKKVWVIDKREQVAGMASDFSKDDYYVSDHGAHILHTNNKKIWDYFSEHTNIINFINKPKVLSKGKIYSFPINLMTLHQLWGVTTPDEARRKLDSVKISCDMPRNFEEWALSMVGREIYEKFFYGYTKKQWFKEPKDLPANIIKRLPIRLHYDENYFNTLYQGMPDKGYTNMVLSMLEGAKVDLGFDFKSIKNTWRNYAKTLVYSGPIDEFFNCEFGKLEYNTMKFECEEKEWDYQGNAVVNHVDIETPYLRSIEYRHFYVKHDKHFRSNKQNKSLICYDYPVEYDKNPIPYYPIQTEKNNLIYKKYESNKPNNVFFGGRLGSYKYINLDEAVGQAMKLSKEIS